MCFYTSCPTADRFYKAMSIHINFSVNKTEPA